MRRFVVLVALAAAVFSVVGGASSAVPAPGRAVVAPMVFIDDPVTVAAYGLDQGQAYECVFEFYPAAEYGTGSRVSGQTAYVDRRGATFCAADPHFLSRGEEGTIEAKLTVDTGVSDYDEPPIDTVSGPAERTFVVP